MCAATGSIVATSSPSEDCSGTISPLASSVGFAQAPATVRRLVLKRSDDSCKAVICEALVKRSRYRVLRCQLGLTETEAHPTMLRSSDCLLSASVRILASTRLTSLTGSRRKTSSGSIPAQSRSFAGSYFLRALDAVDTEEGGWTALKVLGRRT